jgi:hypothetical protein
MLIFLSIGILRRAISWKSTDETEEQVASIFSVEEWVKIKTKLEQVASWQSKKNGFLGYKCLNLINFLLLS